MSHEVIQQKHLNISACIQWTAVSVLTSNVQHCDMPQNLHGHWPRHWALLRTCAAETKLSQPAKTLILLICGTYPVGWTLLLAAGNGLWCFATGFIATHCRKQKLVFVFPSSSGAASCLKSGTHWPLSYLTSKSTEDWWRLYCLCQIGSPYLARIGLAPWVILSCTKDCQAWQVPRRAELVSRSSTAWQSTLIWCYSYFQAMIHGLPMLPQLGIKSPTCWKGVHMVCTPLIQDVSLLCLLTWLPSVAMRGHTCSRILKLQFRKSGRIAYHSFPIIEFQFVVDDCNFCFKYFNPSHLSLCSYACVLQPFSGILQHFPLSRVSTDFRMRANESQKYYESKASVRHILCLQGQSKLSL